MGLDFNSTMSVRPTVITSFSGLLPLVAYFPAAFSFVISEYTSVKKDEHNL